MKTYSISTETIYRLRRRLAFFFGVTATVGTALGLWLITNLLRSAGRLTDLWPAIPFVILVMVITSAFAAHHALSQRQARLESFQIGLGDDYIEQNRGLDKSIRLQRNEIIGIQEWSKGLLVSSTGSKSVFVPVEIGDEAYAELRTVLTCWGSIEAIASTPKLKRAMVAIAWVIGLLIIMLSWSPWLTLIACLAMSGIYLSGWWTRKRRGYSLAISPIKALLFPITMTIIKFTELREAYERVVKSFLGIQ